MEPKTNETKFTYEELLELFKQNMMKFVSGVKKEQEKRERGYGVPAVSPSAPEELKEALEGLVQIQIQNGSFTRKDIPKELNYKIMTFAAKNKISFKEAVSLLIENERYMSPEEIDIQNITNLIEDIRETYKVCEKKYGGLPLNALSEESRGYLSNKKIRVLLKDKLKIMIDLYCPELASVEIIDRSNLFSQDKYFERDDKLLAKIAEEIKEKYTNKSGSVDSLFHPDNADYLNNLLIILRENRMTFDEFIKKVAHLEYTECYRLDAKAAVIKMIGTYFDTYNTYKGITANDPYLRAKIDTVEEHEGTFDLASLLKNFGIVENEVESNHQEMSRAEILNRENELMTTLSGLYPERVIDKGFSVAYPKVYDAAFELSKRMGFASVDEYLESRGYARVNDYVRKSNQKVIMLSEYDLFNYGFLYPDITEQEIIDFIQAFEVELLPVEMYRNIYAKLVGHGKDSRVSKDYHNVPARPNSINPKKWGE